MRAFVAAAVQVAPRSAPLTEATIAANSARATELVRRCVAATGAELVVLPEAVTTGFTPGVDAHALWDLVSDVPGTVLQSYTDVARELGVHLVVGTYARGPDRGVVHNTAAVIGTDGAVLGVYSKTHPFGGERADRGGWVTAGDDPLVVDTALGRIGVIICFDGDYPELSRITAVRGAEVIVRPSALLRSADIWELTNRARAYDNHVFVVGSNATGVDPGQAIYFGNSMIVSPIAEVLARAASHECWVSARLDPDSAMTSLTPGSSVAQPFDHLADRNLALIRKHADALVADAQAPFARR
ncbi:MAG: carbon-nitrogen hydrolase family protein [Nocardioidaceae bacterium]